MLKEVRRGLLSEVRERDERIAELEREKEEREGRSEEGDFAAAENDSSRQDAIAGPPAIVEEIEHQKEDLQKSDTIDANAESVQDDEIEPNEAVEGEPTSQIEQNAEVPPESDTTLQDEKKDEAGPRVEEEQEEGTK